MPSKCRKRKNKLSGGPRPSAKAHYDYPNNIIPSCAKCPNASSLTNVLKDNVNDDILLPSTTPWIVAAVTLIIRVFYVINPDSWWILHPDEVFQSMDVAHSEAYGYGFRPYEFLSPAKGDNLSHYQMREAMLGMNALRSPIYPQLLALVARLVDMLGPTAHPFIIWRTFQVIITSSLPLVASFFAKASGQSSDVAGLASILIGTSAHLNVFGTHTIINSFVSPFIFLALSRLVSLIGNGHERAEEGKYADVTNEADATTLSQLGDVGKYVLHYEPDLKFQSDHIHRPGYDSQANGKSATKFLNSSLATESVFPVHCNNMVEFRNNLIATRESVSSDSGFENWSNSSCGGSSDNSFNECHSDDEDINDDNNCSKNHSSRNHNTNNNNSNNNNIIIITNTTKNNNSSSNKNTDNEDDNKYDNCDGIEQGSHDKKHFFQSQTHQQSLSKAMDILYKTWNSKDIRCFRNLMLKSIADFGAGLSLGISLYVRPDSCIFVALVILASAAITSIVRSVFSKRSLWMFALAAMVGVLSAVADDFYFYQGRLVSPWQWFSFNVLSNLASGLYGSSPFLFYVSAIFFGNVGIVFLSLLFGMAMLHSLLQYVELSAGFKFHKMSFNRTGNTSNNVLNWILVISEGFNTLRNVTMFSSTNRRYTCSIVISLLIYSSFGHKEERFMHDVITLYFIVAASLLISVVHQTFASVFYKKLLLFLLTASFSFTQWQAMPHSNTRDLNQCLYYISHQTDARGLFLESQFSQSFGYSIIHRNIPVLTILQKQFVEFDDTSSIITNRSCFMTKDGCQVGYVSLTSVSNVIHLSNSKGVISHLLDRYQTYNYAIISSSKEFFRPAYAPVFKTDTQIVWRLTDKPDDRRDLQQMARGIVMDASQQSMQEYEAEALKQIGHYWIAVDRCEKALKHTPSKTKLLASMVFCLQRLGLPREARRVFKECLKESDRKECSMGAASRVSHFGSGELS